MVGLVGGGVSGRGLGGDGVAGGGYHAIAVRGDESGGLLQTRLCFKGRERLAFRHITEDNFHEKSGRLDGKLQERSKEFFVLEICGEQRDRDGGVPPANRTAEDSILLASAHQLRGDR